MSYAPYAGVGQPTYSGTWNPWSMYAPPAFQDPQQSINNDLAGNASAMPALQQFGKEAGRTGPSSWANLAQGQQDKYQTDAQSKAASTAAGNAAESRDQLAMRGGLDSGARERIQRNQSRDYMNMTQNASNTRANNGMQIGMNDEQNRVQQLGMMPQMVNQANQGNFQKAGLDFNANTAENAFNLGKFHEQNAAYGANENSKATASSGGSSFICTALRKHGLMTPKETVIMTNFMLRGLKTRADFFAWYLKKGRKAVELAERQRYDFSAIKERYVDDIIALIQAGKEEEAQNLYVNRAGTFVRWFLGAEAQYNKSLEKKNVVRSLLALPSVLLAPEAQAWVKHFYGRKISRKLMTWRTV